MQLLCNECWALELLVLVLKLWGRRSRLQFVLDHKMKIFPKESSICNQIPVMDCSQSLRAPLVRGIQPHAWTQPFTFSIASLLPHLLQFFLFTQSLSPSEHAEVLNSHRELPRERCHKKSIPLATSGTHTQTANSPSNTARKELPTHFAPYLFFSAVDQNWVSEHF